MNARSVVASRRRVKVDGVDVHAPEHMVGARRALLGVRVGDVVPRRLVPAADHLCDARLPSLCRNYIRMDTALQTLKHDDDE